ncbi:MAG TPA: hypothetical protein VGA69_05155 [Nitriliruptorales bacterium]
MNDVGTDAASRLWWAVKRYRVLVVVVVLGAALLGAWRGPDLLADSDEPVYETAALVVAAQLEVRPELLPKTAVALFEAGAVASRTVMATGVGTSPKDLIPGVVRVEPVESSVVIEVIARHADPVLAAELANAAATAFVDVLNRPGALFGTFIVQEFAGRPVQTEPQPGRALPAAVGLFAGLTFALGLIGLYVALRRPVLSPVEVADLAGAPVLGAPNLPKGRSYDPTQVAGLTALLKRVFPDRQGTAVVVGVRGDRGERSNVALLLARGLARTGTVRLVTEAALPAGLGSDEQHNIRETTVLEVDQSRDGVPAVIDGPTAEGMDVPQFLPGDARVVLVVREGTSDRALQAAATQFLPGELFGVLFVPVTRRRARVVVGATPARGRPDPADDPPEPTRSQPPGESGLSGPFARVVDEFEPLPPRSVDHGPSDEPEPSVYRVPTGPEVPGEDRDAYLVEPETEDADWDDAVAWDER